MSVTLVQIRRFVSDGQIRISDHGYEELATDGIWVRDVLQGVTNAELIEDYPEFGKGPCVLVLQWDRDREPIHVVWGIPRGEESPAVLVTAYRPDFDRWEADWRTRK